MPSVTNFTSLSRGKRFRVLMNFWTASSSVIMSYMLATNGITAIQTGRLAQSGLAPYFNQVFISEQLQTQKPDALFMKKLVNRLQVLAKKRR